MPNLSRSLLGAALCVGDVRIPLPPRRPFGGKIPNGQVLLLIWSHKGVPEVQSARLSRERGELVVTYSVTAGGKQGYLLAELSVPPGNWKTVCTLAR